MEHEMMTLTTHLNALDLRFQQVDDDTVVLNFSSTNTSYLVQLQVDGPVLSIRARSSLVVPPRRLPEALVLANHLNATVLKLGAFWIHPAERQLFFEYALVAPDGLSRDQVGWVMAVHHAVDHFYPAFAAVVWGGLSPETALTAALEVGAEEQADSSGEPEADGGFEFAV